MSITGHLLSPDEVVRQGEEIYDRNLRASLELEQRGAIVAIDVDSGDYEVGSDLLDTARRLRAKRPDGQVYLMRVGDMFLHRFHSRTKHERA